MEKKREMFPAPTQEVGAKTTPSSYMLHNLQRSERAQPLPSRSEYK
jgi:hypothetical protein